MKVLFYLPGSMVTKCFAPEDVARLQARHEVILPTGATGEPVTEATLASASDVDAIVTGWGTPRFSDASFDRLERLKVILHAAGSTRFLLPPTFWSRGLRLASANEALGIGVAETTLGMIIAGLKGFFPCAAATRSGGWLTGGSADGWPVRELYQSTVGLIGASKTGRHVIRLLKGFDVRIVVSDPYLNEAEARDLGVERVSLMDLLRQSDVVSLHAPALPETRHMLSHEQFRVMRDGAIFINTARGMIVDEAALADELRIGRIFAFIDVTDPEPPAADHPFRTLPNVVLTPHIAGAINNGCLRMGRSIVDQILEFAEGRTMHGEITADRAAIMA